MKENQTKEMLKSAKGVAKSTIIIGVAIVLIVILLVVKANMGGKTENNAAQNNAGENNAPAEEYVEVLTDGTKLNTSSKLSESKTVGNLQFSNIQLTNQNGQSVLLADVKNTGSTATEVTLVDVILLDKNGNEILTVNGIVAPLEAGATTQFNTSLMTDVANAYDFKVVKK